MKSLILLYLMLFMSSCANHSAVDDFNQKLQSAQYRFDHDLGPPPSTASIDEKTYYDLLVSKKRLADEQQGKPDVLKETTAETMARWKKEESEHHEKYYPTKKWAHECKVDRFTDKKSCWMEKYFFDKCEADSKSHCSVRVELNSELGLILIFGYQNDHKIPGKVRFGKNNPESFKGISVFANQAKRILKQMQTESFGLVRTYIWPNDHAEFEIDLSDFNTAYAKLEKDYSGESDTNKANSEGAQGIYRYVAPDGRIYYSDDPKKGYDYKQVIPTQPRKIN